MRKKATCCTSVALLFALLLAVTGVSAGTLSLVIEKVEDGDTIVVALKGKPERLQLQGIDAPEDVENAKLQRDIKVTGLGSATLLPLGLKATRHLRTLLKPGDIVQASGRFDQRDRYGRVLVVVVDASGRSLNEQMVRDGYAVVTHYGVIEAGLKARLEKLESEAIASKRGLWGESAEAALIGRKN